MSNKDHKFKIPGYRFSLKISEILLGSKGLQSIFNLTLYLSVKLARVPAKKDKQK